MKSRFLNRLSVYGLMLCIAALTQLSCTNDEEEPVVNSVWINMVSRPVEQVACAYPGQTICLRGQYLGDLRRVIVNGTDINLNTLFVYESSSAVTFQLPSDVNTMGDKIRVVTKWGMTDFHFVIRPASEEPQITSFSTTTLIGGRTLTIRGANLQGVTQVWLPLTFDGRILCPLVGEQDADGTNVKVTIPEDVSFAKGQCEIVMEKTDDERGITYTEKAYSTTTNFSN